MDVTAKLIVKLLKLVSTPQQALIVWTAIGVVSGMALIAALYVPLL